MVCIADVVRSVDIVEPDESYMQDFGHLNEKAQHDKRGHRLSRHLQVSFSSRHVEYPLPLPSELLEDLI